jgi:hypothetical protein
MAGKVIRKLAQSLDEILALGGAKTAARVPSSVRRVGTTGTGPLVKGFHGTNSPTDYPSLKIPAEGINQGGIHVTRDPDLASSYSGIRAAEDFDGPAGYTGPPFKPRVYPLAVDPGRTLQVPEEWGLPNWWDPEWFKMVSQQNPDSPVTAEALFNLSSMMDESGNVGQHLDKLGYDSLSYMHHHPFAVEGQSPSLLIPDENRILPLWSSEAQEAIKKRGILDMTRVPKDMWE